MGISSPFSRPLYLTQNFLYCTHMMGLSDQYLSYRIGSRTHDAAFRTVEVEPGQIKLTDTKGNEDSE